MVTSLSFGWLTNQQEDEHEWPTDPFLYILCTLPPSDNRAGRRTRPWSRADSECAPSADAALIYFFFFFFFLTNYALNLSVSNITEMQPVAASFVIVCQKVISGGSMCLCFFMPNIFAYVDKQSAVNRIYKGTTYKKKI